MTSHNPALPVELITHIFEHLDSPSTLRNAVLCSHEFHDIITPILYRNVDIYHGEVESSVKIPSPNESVLKHITLLFLRRPDLAAHVRHFSLRPAFADNLLVYDDPPKLSVEEFLAQDEELEDEIKTAIANASHDEQEHAKWLEQAKVDDCMLALLLPCFKKLESLDLEFPISPQYVDRMFERAARKEKPFTDNPPFTKLESFFWSHVDDKYGGHWTAFPFLVPSVQEVYFRQISSSDGDEVDDKLARVEHGTSNCTFIELRDCRLNDGDIKAILSIPKALKTFIYEFGWAHLSYCSVSFKVLRDTLETHKESLEYLCLDWIHDGIEWINEVDDTTPLASLRAFPNLRHLRIGPDFVFGTHTENNLHERLLTLLPEQLETLHIKHGDNFGHMLDGNNVAAHDGFETLYRGLGLLFENKNSTVPALRKVMLDTTVTRAKEDGDWLKDLLRLAESVKVEFLLRNNNRDEEAANYDTRVERGWGWDEDVRWKKLTTWHNMLPEYEIMELPDVWDSRI